MAQTRLLSALGVVGVVALISPASAHADEEAPLSSDTYGGIFLAEGVATFPTDDALELMLAAEHFDIPDTVEVWAHAPEGGDPVLIGSGETESDIYTNPGAETATEQEVELIEVTLPSPEVSSSGWYAFVALDESTGDLITWSSYPVIGEDGGELGGSPGEQWPVPDFSENVEPTSEPPTVEALTEQTYGLVSINEDAPVIPVDETFTLQTDSGEERTDLWLLPPGGEDAIFLTTEPASDGLGMTPGTMPWRTVVRGEEVDYKGIYSLVATAESEGVVAWTPFALSPDGSSLEPGDPGVDESDAAFSDRSIWPIPDSVAGPEATAENGEDEDTERDGDNAPASPDAETTDSDTADAEQTSGSDAGSPWALITAVIGGLVLITTAGYVLWRRDKA